MSNLSRLEAVSDALDTAISTANSLPEAGGGGSIETCTVKAFSTQDINSNDGSPIQGAYTCYTNGTFEPKAICADTITSGETTIYEVVKGSSFVCIPTGPNPPIVTENCEVLGRLMPMSQSGVVGYIFRAPESGEAIVKFVNQPCFIEGTLIQLANNTLMPVENINYNTELLVWDFDNGCYASAKPLWIKKVQRTKSYYHCIFENNTTLDIVGSNGNCHAVFSVDDNCFEYANKCVGKNIMTTGGIVKLLSCELINETVDFYNVITDYHMNCYANGVLTSTKMNNLYPISNMKFEKESRELIPYEAFENIPIEFYKGLRLSEIKSEHINTIQDKLNMLLALMKHIED